jgi:hypothetical protein
MVINQHADPEFSRGREVAAYAALSRITLADQPLQETLSELAALARRALPEAPEVSVTLLTEGRAHTAAYDGEIALRLDMLQYDDGHGPCLDAAVSGGSIQLVMDDPGGPYPSLRESARQAGVTHSLSAGVPAAGRSTGALNLYSAVGPFSADSRRIASTFAGFTGYALARAGRDHDTAAAAAELQQALASRALVSQAQGILMARSHCSRDQAFARLIQRAEQGGMRLRDVAQAVIDELTD